MGPDAPSPPLCPAGRSHAGAHVLLLIATAASVLFLVGGSAVGPWPAAALLALGGAAPIGLVVLERRGTRVPLGAVVTAIAVALAVAVAVGPRTSHDLWSYVMYGRIAAVHHASPWAHAPAAFPTDPLLTRVAGGWRHTPSVYGPVFAAYAALGAAVGGTHPLLLRLFHQLGAAVALGVALTVVWRRTRSTAALALLGLSPVIVVTVVNGGHNDLLVGLAVLGAALFVERDRPTAAGALLGVGALVKLTALLPLAGLAVLLARRGRGRAAAELAASGVGAVALGYAATGPAGFRALQANARIISRWSGWGIALRAFGLRERHASLLGLGHAASLADLGKAAVVASALLGAALVAARRATPSPLRAAGTAGAAYLVAGSYTLPWYAAWSLPALVVDGASDLALVVAGIAGALVVGYTAPGPDLHAALATTSGMLTTLLPVVALGLFVVAALVPDGRRRAPAAAELVPA